MPNIDIDTDLVEATKLPIEYQTDSMKLNNSIINDLELIETIEPNNKSIYEHIFSPSTYFGKAMCKKMPLIYSTNTDYLKDTQTLIKSGFSNVSSKDDSYNFDNILNTYKEIKEETGFCEKYLYIDWEHAKFLNTNPAFLQILSVYNLASPLLSLCLPIILLVIPFFILKVKGIEITLDMYTSILKKLIGDHAIGKIFTKFNDVDVKEKAYILMSVAFYFFSIYQNILTCIRFYNNITKIHQHLFYLREYIEYTTNKMDQFLLVSSNLITYNAFNQEVIRNKNYLETMQINLQKISPFSLSFSKVFEIGHIMEQFYKVFDDVQMNNILLFSFGFNGYIDCLNGLSDKVNNGHINFVKFNKSKSKSKKPIFKDLYYPALINSKPVKNTCDLYKNMVITGPNASGKTTILKTCLINVIISQQFGCGTYKSGKLTPFKYIHCYLNIPDTSGRDSLFQAEARRCKEIIDTINANKNTAHFCVFDELYSGTNPEEAVVSATAFMEYLYSFKNVTTMLTTHYIELCKELEKTNTKLVTNYHMETNKLDKKGAFNYTYNLKEGISNVKGGLKVLSDMDYPSEILEKFI
jgi:DNA mismatch repair ATPase MutS